MENNRKIELVPYSPMWRKFFEKEEATLKRLLKGNLIQAHHIGSTAITSIVAKPTLDILAEVHTLDGIEVFKDEFERAGLTWKGEFGIEGRLYFIRPSPDGISHMAHIHIFETTSKHIQDHLDFRDYLNAEPEVAKEYETLKLTLKEQFEDSPELYTAGKNEFIKTVLQNIS
jgi:GrpB-like predicted nucleotidyltransferase (UPF0157 family)